MSPPPQVPPAAAAASVTTLAAGTQTLSPTQLAINLTLPGQDATDFPVQLFLDWDWPGGGQANYSSIPIVAASAAALPIRPSWQYRMPGVKTVRALVIEADGGKTEVTLSPFTVR